MDEHGIHPNNFALARAIAGDKSDNLPGIPRAGLKTIKNRLDNYNPILPEISGGYQKMYIDHVMQADKGADLDFLIGKRGAEVKRHSH